ncbi:MAG: patatin-like phospholipase family protein [Bacteroidales bacterium]
MKRIIICILFIITLNLAAGAQSVGLVLSGGGAKGLSHIGVIKALEENDIPIDYICGTSMGAIVGGLYSIGLSPDEMLTLFRSPEFESWYKGMPEQAYATYFYRDDPSPKMFSFSFAKKNDKIKIDLPTSLVPPYSMDLAVMQIFTSPASACKYNFDSLMIPFFCVASDIARKEPRIMESGDLGAAIRASMTYPFYFKPITIDSTLLFDGGFYNNFPWDIMEKKYSPHYIIGAKCVVGDLKIDEEDVVTQVTNMLMVQTDYDIPTEKGIVIHKKYPYGIMDFNKLDEIVEMGYRNALPYIAEIKKKVQRKRNQKQLDSMRLGFRTQCNEVRFFRDLEISGNLNASETHFIDRTIRNDEVADFDFNKLKRGYYRVIASNMLKTFYPSFQELNDSLFMLKLKVTKASPFNVSIGGNISSSSLNQGYIGAAYTHLARNPWKISLGLNLGKYYKGGDVRWRHDISVKPLAFYDAQFVIHQFDYYNGNQNLFTPDKIPNNVQQREVFLKIGMGTPLAIKRNLLFRIDFVMGREQFRYFPVENFTVKDIPDRTQIDLFSSSFSIQRNTQNYLIYPTEGKKELLSFRYTYGKEGYEPGSTTYKGKSLRGIKHGMPLLKFSVDSYIKISPFFRLGYLVDVVLSNNNDMSNYLSTLLYMPSFEPIPHSKTLMMTNYRANSYVGIGLSPVFLFTKTFYIHTTFSYFQPYQQLRALKGGAYEYSKRFPVGGIIANMALAWQSPIGPVSFSTSYYQRGEYNKWYPQLNIGFLLFKKKALEN